MVPVLGSHTCRALTSEREFRYVCGRLVCDHCRAENPQRRMHAVQTRDIFVSSVADDLWSI